MIAGVHGRLLSESFLDRYLEEQRASAGSATWQLTVVGRALGRWKRHLEQLGPSSNVRTIFETAAEPLVRILGFERCIGAAVGDERVVALLAGVRSPVALIVTRWSEALDAQWRPAVIDARHRGASWALLFNGRELRIVDARRLHSRRHIAFDLDVALQDHAACAAMATIAASGMFEPSDPATPAVAPTPLESLIDQSDRHGVGVCRSLRDGVIEASQEVLRSIVARLRRGPGREASYVAFEQSLTIVYRILFLLFAEARGLLPVWHPVYQESYSIDALSRAALADGTSRGLWDALRAASRLAHAGCRAGSLHVPPFNGRLFSPAETPMAERRDLDDGAARRTLVALSSRAAPGGGRETIAYRDLGVEQLGAVYETLLDYEPRFTNPVAHQAKARRHVSLEPGSLVRKATGSFYTPQPIAHYLVRRTLTPLVDRASPGQILALRIVDPAMGSGAFLVAACAFLAGAYERALVDHGECHAADLGPSESQAIRRTIAERCLYGVDLNPMAVQLARLSLWLATLSAGRPLTFLDHHFQTGNSLIGAWVASLRRPPADRVRRRQDLELPLFDHLPLESALRDVLPVRFSLANEPDETVEHVRRKERALAALNRRESALSKWKRVADLWCASWFSRRPPPRAAFADLSDSIVRGTGALPSATITPWLAAAEETAASQRFFHWELEFPELFFSGDGVPASGRGFDAVIGNPPWDVLRADAGTVEQRATDRTGTSAMTRFIRESGCYETQPTGHANRYQLFVERAIALLKPGGRLGLIVPGGLATDQGSAPLRRLLFSRSAIDAIVGFENRSGIFPIHRSTRFLLLTASAGRETTEFGCRLGERDAAALDSDESHGWFPVRMTPSLVERISGHEYAIPEVRSPTDLTIAERSAALFPPLGDGEGWGVRFGRELNATEDRALFVPPDRPGVPVVEGKHLDPFRVRLEAVRWRVTRHDAERAIGPRWQRQRLAYRDVAGAGNRVTLIAAILPAGCVSTHTVFCARTPLHGRRQWFLCGLFNSLMLNYLARLRVSTHVTTAIVERLPVPLVDQTNGAWMTIAALARSLSRGDNPHGWAVLNASVARLYSLTDGDFAHVLSTFPLVAESQRAAAYDAFRQQRLRS